MSILPRKVRFIRRKLCAPELQLFSQHEYSGEQRNRLDVPSRFYIFDYEFLIVTAVQKKNNSVRANNEIR